MITFLRASDNNRASTVLESFSQATQTYGWPNRIRADHGRENWDVKKAIETVSIVVRSFKAPQFTISALKDSGWIFSVGAPTDCLQLQFDPLKDPVRLLGDEDEDDEFRAHRDRDFSDYGIDHFERGATHRHNERDPYVPLDPVIEYRLWPEAPGPYRTTLAFNAT
ncbi:hypothetical protein TREMEDRAFT_60546 [Tremella mesenterica DSM 1558]|uniref:uncharacterized protein n=1 Tax=Tremella mesenterica (strain ATCC 24925 / CBS 8224 / DSM 1558 / NBRC 9311 / NRRL Y-6157 / RJB 2259-6 / UBC 559-6) TaxID=578456 RepID=UPI0003F4A55E|nr:uncharacterized protein TREMEDRAFT_60546 [Tremella mesenterica DSM 1558]EIW71624.1 hypothetical protein TREMEDRAFT_60546 [Tremella mesenterica DSM 1558]